MSNNEEFLKAYKELENALSNICKDTEDSPVFWYENQIKEASKQNKLRLCRTARNFLQHNDNDSFFEATISMIGFLKKLTDEISSKFETCGQIMIKASAKTVWDVNDKLSELLPTLNKNGVALVMDKDKIKGIYTPKQYLELSLKTKIGKTTKVSKFEKTEFAFISKNAPTSDLLNLKEDGFKAALVTDSGKKTEKLLGYILI